MQDNLVDQKAKCKVKLQYLLICATAMSTTLSLLGGLLMYFESLKSLEGVVEDVSDAQVQGLRKELRSCIDEVQQVEKEMNTLIRERFDAQHPVTLNPNGTLSADSVDVESWADSAEWAIWPRVRWSYWIDEIGIEAIPHDPKDPALFYYHTWKDLLQDGGVEYVKALYNQNHDHGHGLEAHVFGVTPDNGTIVKENYNFDLEVSKLTCHPNMSAEGAPGSKVMSCAERPEAWLSGDLTPFIYIYVDTWYMAPPPPHPWSKYKFVGIKAAWFFYQWEAALQSYAERTSNTKVVIFDALSGIVYATSTGQQLLDGPCLGTDRNALKEKQHCIMHLVNDSQMHGTWNTVGQQRPGFWKKGIKGGEHFVRTETLMTLDDGFNATRFDAIILWIQSTSVVQDQINAALVLLIIFCCVVLCCDLTVMILEYVTVVVPVSQIADSTSHLTTMDIEGARRGVLVAVRKVSVTEVVHLASGLLFACNVLDQYKAYLPSTLFIEGVESGGTSTERTSDMSGRSTKTRSRRVSRRERDEAAGDLKSRLNVGLNNMKGALLKLYLRHEGGKLLCPAFAETISIIQEKLQKTEGVLHTYTLTDPNVLYLSWGIAGNCSDALYKACVCADLLKTSGLVGWAGVTHGMMQAGNIGNSVNKGFAMMGTPLCALKVAYKAAEYFVQKRDMPIVILPLKLADVMQGRIITAAVGLVLNEAQATIICEANGSVTGENEEWMYSLETSPSDPLVGVFRKLKGIPNCNEEIPEAVYAVDRSRLTPVQEWVYEQLMQKAFYLRLSPGHLKNYELDLPPYVG
eukprot:TRINITY_DN1997_c0_g3_i1.p1 TRINITY_DN1997_c0_g3~~TRINITY_DN1997_c0_g3_i1.p1  ORF type:complete len:800 (+),score=186.96 TRINITY_DN1997_c0_g3_i1:36-2435(+)